MKEEIAKGSMLPLMEDFYTIQGEGFNTGKAAYFVRLGGCDVGCHWCDVKESWNALDHPVVSINEIVERAKNHNADTIVITGGEPLMYNLDLLTHAIRAEGMQVLLETSGAYPLSGVWDWICVSPKKFKQPLPEVLQSAHELKVIVFNNHDFRWGEEHSKSVNQNCKLFLQPEWSKFDTVVEDLVAYVKQNPRWMVSLQTHKFLNIP